jgi:hypothetical protein
VHQLPAANFNAWSRKVKQVEKGSVAKEKSLLAACAGEFIVKLVDVGCEIFAASIVMELCQGTLPTKVRDVKFVSKASHQLLNPGKNWCAIHNGFHDVGGTPGVSTDCPRFLFMHIIFSLFFPSLSTLFLHVFEAFCPRFSFVFSSFMSTCSLFFFPSFLRTSSCFFQHFVHFVHVFFFCFSSFMSACSLLFVQPFVRGSSCFFPAFCARFFLFFLQHFVRIRSCLLLFADTFSSFCRVFFVFFEPFVHTGGCLLQALCTHHISCGIGAFAAEVKINSPKNGMLGSIAVSKRCQSMVCVAKLASRHGPAAHSDKD